MRCAWASSSSLRPSQYTVPVLPRLSSSCASSRDLTSKRPAGVSTRPLQRVARARCGAGPDSPGREAHAVGSEDLQRTGSAAKAAARPQAAAVGTAQAEGRQRAAVVEVHADPVPADRVGVHQLVAPFVVEPGFAAHGLRLAAALQRALHRQLGLAQVVAGLGDIRPLAREAGITLQQQRLGGVQLQLQREFARAEGGGVTAAAIDRLALQRPTAEQQVGVARRRPRQRRCLVARPARDALRMQMRFRAQVGQRGMGKQQVPRREAAVQTFGQPGAAAEEGDLEAVALAVGRAQVAGDVPPLDRRAQVGAVVARKLQHAAAAHRVVGGKRAAAGQRQQQHRQAVAAAHHQSSLTDSKAPRDAAARAL